MRRAASIVLLTVIASSMTACFPSRYFPERATRPYPFELQVERQANVQVRRDSDAIVMVNATAEAFRDFDLWLNQRYMHRIESLEPGETVRVSLDAFVDVWGGGPNPGGAFRWYEPTPIVLAEAQLSEDAPLVAFIALPREESLGRRPR